MQKAPEVMKASLCLRSIHYKTEKYVSVFYNSIVFSTACTIIFIQILFYFRTC